MTSAIVSASIDDAFPVAGVDNDSQGFRDNFNVIKTGLATAASEITDLQTNAARIDQNNDFDGNLISNAVTSRVYGSAYQTTITTNSNVNLNDGEYQQLQINNNCILTFINWPQEDQYGKIRLELRSDGISQKEVTFSTESAGVVKYEIGALLTKTTGAHRNAKVGSATSTEFSFPTGNITSGAFEAANFLYGTGLIGSVSISTVSALGAANATTTVAPVQINYSDITVGSEVVVVMAASIALVNNGDPVTLANTTGLTGINNSTEYYAFKDGGNIKLSSTAGSYTAITAATGTYTGGTQAATFPLTANANRVTLSSAIASSMYVNMPITFTGTGFGGISAGTYYVHSIIDSTGIRLKDISGTLITLTAASGTLAIQPRTVLVTSFISQAVTAATNLTLTVNSPILPEQKLVLDADNAKVQIIEAWKQPSPNVGSPNIVYVKYVGEFG